MPEAGEDKSKTVSFGYGRTSAPINSQEVWVGFLQKIKPDNCQHGVGRGS